MFDTLSNSLQGIFNRLRGHGRLSEADVREALREVRLALLEADVNFQVAKDFIDRVAAACVGEEVLKSITPGQQVVKRVHDELVALLGGIHRPLDMNSRPATLMLVGLHGSGKTTTAAKLAAMWKQQGKTVLLVACDIRRPAAVEQLSILAGQVGVDIITPLPGETVPAVGARGLKAGWDTMRDVVLFDTGGRFQVDRELVAELHELRMATNARNVLLVIDAALGQESVNVASVFHRDVGLTGLVLTKLDGDARGGAALSIQSVTGCPILFAGTGEHTGDLEPFYPERMASRILGMGDIVSLVEKVQAAVDVSKVADLEKKMRSNKFDLEDFLDQTRQMKKMGPIGNLLDMLPVGGQARTKMKAQMDAGGTQEIERFVKRSEAIILSMTPRERRNPDLLNASRRRRIAQGSGSQVSDINDLIRQFDQARQMMRRLGKMQKKLQFMR